MADTNSDETILIKRSNLLEDSPATRVYRSASEAFKTDKTILKKSDKFNNTYKDMVDEISENTVDSSDQVSEVSEEILMRLEIAKLQQEVEMMRASRKTFIINTSNNKINEDLANYLQRNNRTTIIMKILTEFRD
ncbi:hypothetical protein PAAG_11793 [Paracoccidioides lutzii Pb01]|uniref:Uncharacterized protein n=1 Tax=Paracoccidioides lutzii (strain ATCC MYA-826 / Pb01) TaxID=502779 RepID=A0A0A2V0U9_PARBA|nr:hypothetical protein PAAG_11793 [Paracoccidioides lutzii Pb01]KGQ01446.1 hypothetical protein PAAG_11793 [Paracoccidioides lutzii Pb01]